MKQRAKKILVVDDEPTIRQLFDLLLSDAGYEVVTAEDGASAIQKAQSSVFDLVFLDLLLPDKPGSQIYIELKRLNPPPLVCIITAMDEQRFGEYTRAIEIGNGDQFLRKPIGRAEIL